MVRERWRGLSQKTAECRGGQHGSHRELSADRCACYASVSVSRDQSSMARFTLHRRMALRRREKPSHATVGLRPRRRPKIVRIPCIFPADQGVGPGDGFARDWLHRQPVCGCRDFAPATRDHPRNSRAFAGSWERGHGRIGTGDGELRADSGELVAFVSVAKFGGPVSLPIRLIGNTGSSNSLRSPSPVPALLAELASQPLRAVQSWDRASRQPRNGRCRIHAGRSTVSSTRGYASQGDRHGLRPTSVPAFSIRESLTFRIGRVSAQDGREPRPRATSGVDRELLPKNELDNGLVLSAAE